MSNKGEEEYSFRGAGKLSVLSEKTQVCLLPVKPIYFIGIS